MPTITKIAQQKKRKGRYSIFIDDEYAFSVEEDVLISFSLQKGMPLTSSKIDDITRQDQFQRAYSFAIHYLSYRMRTVEEIRIYLLKKEISPIWIEEIIEKLNAKGLLNDEQFANAYVRDRMTQTSKGPDLIKKELIEKGVGESAAANAVKHYDKQTQMETVQKWLIKEQRKKSQHAFRKRNEQLRMKLYQKGFHRDVITEVFTLHQPEPDYDREVEIFNKQADKLYRKHSKKFAGFDLHMKLKALLFQKGFQSDMIEAYISKLQHDENEPGR